MKRVSIIVPVLDEIAHVDDLLRDVAGQDYEGEVELLIADGGSVDGTRERILDWSHRGILSITMVDNERRYVAPGLNACIRRATGELIIRMDCHSRYPADYVRRCVEVSEATGAWNVGGVYTPVGVTAMERAVACALTSPFGGVNWARGTEQEQETDTVYLGAFSPRAFQEAGLYDESLIRNQDDELNLRIRRAGGRIIFSPAIQVRYRPRGSFRSLWSQYFGYGFWKVVVMRKHKRVLNARSLAPAAFVTHLTAVGLAAAISPTGRRALAATMSLYGLAAGGFAITAINKRKESFELLPGVMASFPCLHLAYGVGTASGLVREIQQTLQLGGLTSRQNGDARPSSSSGTPAATNESASQLKNAK